MEKTFLYLHKLLSQHSPSTTSAGADINITKYSSLALNPLRLKEPKDESSEVSEPSFETLNY